MTAGMQRLTELTKIEHFRPIPLRFNASLPSRMAFALRCFVDLQLGTIWTFLGPRLAALHGNLLDVGCGEMPYRSFLPSSVRYTGYRRAAGKRFQYERQ